MAEIKKKRWTAASIDKDVENLGPIAGGSEKMVHLFWKKVW